MKMFAQLIIEEKILLQTLPVASEHDQTSWKLSFGCNMCVCHGFVLYNWDSLQLSLLLSPAHAIVFSVAVLRQSETEGTRLLGYVEIGRDKVLGSVGLNSSSRCSPLTLNIITED
jgi:hypothetical protein